MTRKPTRRKPRDAVEIELWKHRLASVAREMGLVLRQASYSANIKERRDCSTAIFDATGRMLTQGDDIPVHLGSMPMSVAAACERVSWRPGDAVLLNDPFCGGTHLPDITLVQPVFHSRKKGPSFFVANRAHHADVGGMTPGSMPLAREIQQEGLRIPPIKLIREGQLQEDLLGFILANVRTPDERRGDLRAQIAANEIGARRLAGLLHDHGQSRLQNVCAMLLDYTAATMRGLIRGIPDGDYTATDYLDDDGLQAREIPIRVVVRVRRAAVTVDFRDSAPQVPGGMNAVQAITHSAVFYVFRCLLDQSIPSNAGCMRPIQVLTTPGTVVAAEPPASVAAGNVETAQRLVDVLLAALQPALPQRIPAASCGSMNNITIGGLDAQRRPYTYYETIAGGMGARPTRDGLSGVHTHMTNSLNTPIEALHHQYPFRVRKYALRRQSGGAGRFTGGDGLIREYEFFSEARVTVLSERRRLEVPGAAGGGAGRVGRNRLWRAGRWKSLPGKFEMAVQAGDRLRLETPGGGGWGEPGTPA